MDGADVCRTSSRASRRPPDVTCGAAILDSRWERRKWRQPRLGAAFSTPIEEWGARWRPFRFRRPSWMTSFAEPRMRSSKMAAGSGRAAILLLTPQWGSKRPPYTTSASLALCLGTSPVTGHLWNIAVQPAVGCYNSWANIRRSGCSPQVEISLWNGTMWGISAELRWDNTKLLTHLPLEKIAAISQTIFSDAFSWMKNFVFWLKFHWYLFLRIQLTISQHWFR